jgi:TetR/AcrR family transcriptional regulator, cholesterol catabolism regulator
VSIASAAKAANRRAMSADERRQQIVDTAAKLFDSDGFERTSMDKIASEVGIAKPTLYHYFTSKNEILFDIHGVFIDLLLARQAARVDTGVSAAEQLREVMADILELMETHRGHVRVFFENHRELPADKRETIRFKRDQYQQAVETILATGVQAGEFRALDVRLTSLHVFGACNWAYQWYRGGKLSTREIADQYWDHLIHGISR